MGEGTATLVGRRGEFLHAEQIESAVTSAGFTPRDMTATAVGSLSSHDEDVVLRWADSDVEILLEGGSAFDRLAQSLASAERLRVTGTLTVRRDEEAESRSLVMTVEEFAAVDDRN